MTLSRRALLAAPALLALPAHAQEVWPSRPVRIVVPYPPGGGSDVTARLVAPGLQQVLGQSVIIDNRAGATGIVGTEAVARAAPDGYTLVLADTPHSIVPALNRNLPYDLLADFVPVSTIGVAPQILFASPALPVGTAAELAALARQRPDALSVASAGIAGLSHLMAELFQVRTGTKLVHVPYRGSGPALQDLAAGQVQVSFSTMLTGAPFLQNGTVKVLGVASEQRLPELPNVATFREQGIDLVVDQWWGLLAPARTPAAVVRRLAEATAAAVALPETHPRIAQTGMVPRAQGSAAFDALIRADLVRWAEVVRVANIRLD